MKNDILVKLLNSYVSLKIDNENYKLEIIELKNNYDLKAVALNEKTGSTNKITHEIEERIINNEKKIKYYENQIIVNECTIKKLENLTRCLNEIECEAIKLKYMNEPILNRKYIASKLNITPAGLDKIIKRAIGKMLTQSNKQRVAKSC